MRGGYRPGAGRPKGAKIKSQSGNIQNDIADEADALENLEPLDFMLRIMNDPKEPKELRARMAIAAASFVHSRPSEGKGKKAGAEEKARAAGSGRFATSAPPKLKIVK